MDNRNKSTDDYAAYVAKEMFQNASNTETESHSSSRENESGNGFQSENEFDSERGNRDSTKVARHLSFLVMKYLTLFS